MGRKMRELYNRKFFPKPPSTAPAALYYKGVLTEANVQLCRQFVAQNKRAFDQANARYGVPPSIAVSLLFVETRLGKVLADVPENAFYTLASMDGRFQVKRIIVNPGAELSLQMHHHRAEHWVVVSGTAEVTNGDVVRLFTENQSTYIPVGTKHRLKNPGVIPLTLIEIQSGAYLGEDDIVRFADVYGREG